MKPGPGAYMPEKVLTLLIMVHDEILFESFQKKHPLLLSIIL